MPLDLQSITSRHGFSPDAVLAAWNSLRDGNGSMAQFNHPEFGGGGQWMPGMIMIGDIFNNGLKSRVDALFHELQNEPADAPAPPSPTLRQPSQSQHSGEPGVSLRYGSTASHSGSWYPPELGHPSTSGSQNNVRYAYFPGPRRLAIELFGNVTLYDTGPHIISGISQVQSDDAGTIAFTSQSGVIPLSTLQVVR